MKRRALLTVAAATSVWPALAQAFPTRPVRIVVPFGPGGLADLVVRVVGQALAARIGQQVVVDNRPGAGGALAAQAASGAAADGHTLILFTSGTAISRALFRNLPFDPVGGFVPVTTLAIFDALLLVPDRSPLHGVADLRARGAGEPLNIATLTAGSTQHLTGEMFRLATGLTITLVPFRTSPEVLTALRRGDVDLAIDSYGAAAGELAAGSVRVLASTGRHRSPLLPQVPTLAESGLPDCVMEGWNALFVPAGTPREAVEQVNALLRDVLAAPPIRARLLELGVQARATSPEELGGLLRADIALWNGVIDRAGIERQ
jgi:tripartite-type tricarboxylate transporter receptor subunit TctC